ncbi:hypothetical protein FF098_014925 [Parvularcula flava]|uniref:Uncharacterized protein n=1 Tax=Aquisalinus luteolus TaxID=1566827 RepID=A0A8J3A5P6_9PROT|nr:hypothetical protein [Aquisalinus luteolus]NHK29211.1 hypothetical protein [Aquisalinus luteolus]GGH99954.1 hypothetical protein GCM10011355_27110 [Aquisalinus luteolus]
MSEKNFLFCPPNSLPDEAIETLKSHGVVVIATEHFRDMRITSTEPLLPHSTALAAAMKAIRKSEASTKHFGELMAELLQTTDV